MIRSLIPILTGMLMLSCSGDQSTNSQQPEKKWRFDPPIQVIKNGSDIDDPNDASTVDYVAASDPSILVDDDGYKLYYTCVGVTQAEIDAAQSADPPDPSEPKPKSRICVATSSDGITFTRHQNNPILELSDSGWDSFALETPFVMKVGGEYRLYYNGYNKTATSTDDIPVGGEDTLGSIGLAVSDDGISFARASTEPVLKPSPLTNIDDGVGAWDSWVVEGPYVIEVGSEYWMYYGGAGSVVASKMINAIGLAVSSDGKTWRKSSQNPIIIEGSASSWDRYHVIDPSVIWHDGQYILWYHGGDTFLTNGTDDEYANFHIGVAHSDDGINWVKGSSNPILKNSVLDWTLCGIMAPSVIAESDRFVMYFHGLDGTMNTYDNSTFKQFEVWAIGRATLLK